MTSLKVKKRLMYTVFAFIFLCGGIEYAVILPTLWLYLHNEYGVPEYMLGLVLSAYSVAAALASPVTGRVSDRTRNSKRIFIVCTLFELGGSFLYFADVSVAMCLVSRFISGLGAGSEAIVFAEVSRYTSEKERTGILSKLAAIRQIALLMGPGFNIFLREADFTIGPFKVNKYTSPGGFLVGIWTFLLVLILLLYYEPAQVYTQEMEESRATAVSDVEKVAWPKRQISCSGGIDEPNNHHNVAHEEIPDERKVPPQYANGGSAVNSTHSVTTHPTERTEQKGTDRQVSPSRVVDEDADMVWDGNGTDTYSNAHPYGKNGEEDQRCFPSLHQRHDDLQGSEREPAGLPAKSDPPQVGEMESEDPSQIEFPETSALGTSIDLMMSAENFISDSLLSASEREADATGSNEGEENKEGGKGAEQEGGINLVFDEHHFGAEEEEDEGRYDSRGGYAVVFSGPRSAADDERTRLLGRQTSAVRGLSNEPYIHRSTQVLDDPLIREGRLGFFCNEYIRDEVVAVIYVIFCTMFSQVCVETMVTPLSLKYLDFGELENSLMYCACGVEIIIVFVLVSVFSRCVCDRNMIIFGAFMNLASNCWLIWFVPEAEPHNRDGNLLFFSIPVFLDVLSLPFLFVCSTSLFSKLTRKETQGLSQGLRRTVVGLGTVLAPLWGSSTVNSPHILFGVLVALQGLALLLLLGSFTKLKGWRESLKDRENPALATESAQTVPASARSASAGHSVQRQNSYGSIQQQRPLVTEASYQSLSAAALEDAGRQPTPPAAV
ncbi:uncharacterized protein LOC101859427 [Aplysia californica]|uniref:Uncharacterized protein LOC101859427 n=1 Tax=Aplysia californica TaxID=6500 RepID=A0ABM0JY12_APLCA|nr:uncharacterized protein LOC101859427 [Aplysia californica]XP_035827159.1 uncharacterized protein LOC101859427 [Aplysia californica]